MPKIKVNEELLSEISSLKDFENQISYSFLKTSIGSQLKIDAQKYEIEILYDKTNFELTTYEIIKFQTYIPFVLITFVNLLIFMCLTRFFIKRSKYFAEKVLSTVRKGEKMDHDSLVFFTLLFQHEFIHALAKFLLFEALENLVYKFFKYSEKELMATESTLNDRTEKLFANDNALAEVFVPKKESSDEEV